jgi:hypothetical protein
MDFVPSLVKISASAYHTDEVIDKRRKNVPEEKSGIQREKSELSLKRSSVVCKEISIND